MEEIQEGQTLTNEQRLVYEFNDIYAMMELLQEEGLIDAIIDYDAVVKKKEKVKKYLEYSIKLGQVK